MTFINRNLFLLTVALLLFCLFPAKAKSDECKNIANEYKIKIIAAPTSPFNTNPAKYNFKIADKIDSEQYLFSLKNLKTNEISSVVLLKKCNDLSFNLSFQFIDQSGSTGTIGASYLLSYECNTKIRDKKGSFTGNCTYANNHLGNIQIQDKLDIYGENIKQNH